MYVPDYDDDCKEGMGDVGSAERDILPMGCSRRIDPDETDRKGSSVIRKVNQSLGERSG